MIKHKFDWWGKKHTESQCLGSLENLGKRWYKAQEPERIIREKGER